MSDTNSWKQEYTQLSNFINEHPEVEVGVSRVRIPENIRPEFYQLFNTVRTVFIEEKLADLLNEARSLSERYIKVEAEVVTLLELEKISQETHLYSFLHNPIDELIRGLFNPLFDLLKGKVDIETFGEKALSNIEVSFRDLYHLGYEKWVALSLVKLLQADKLFQVIPRPFISEQEETIMSSTSPEEDPPAAIESKNFSFQRDLAATFTVPDFIVHLSAGNKYTAVRSQIGEALAKASKTSENREWYPLDSIGAFISGLTLVYVADNLKDISLVADADKICRPDLIIVCKEQQDWYDKEGLGKIKLDHDRSKPLLGTYVVSRESIPEQAYKDLITEESVAPTLGEERLEQGDSKQAGIYILTVGFNQSKLQPIVSGLMNNRQGLHNES